MSSVFRTRRAWIPSRPSPPAKRTCLPSVGGAGRHHGGSDDSGAKKPASSKKKQDPLPVEFKAQLKALEKRYEAVGQAMKSNEVGQVKAAFGAFRSSLKAVNGLLLSGHRRMMWDELEMLLGNDAVEGHRHIEQVKDARRVFKSLVGNMRRVRTAFL